MKLSKDRIIQISLAGAVAILAIVVIVLAVNKPNQPDLSFVLNGQEEGAVTDETAQPADEGSKTDTGTSTKTTTTTKTTTATSTTTSAATGSGCKPGLSGKKSDMPKSILLNWTACTNNDDFQFYKLVKSATNPNPTYPSAPAVMSSTDIRLSNYVDKTVAPNTTYYYRVCVVQRLSKTSCGNAISVKY